MSGKEGPGWGRAGERHAQHAEGLHLQRTGLNRRAPLLAFLKQTLPQQRMRQTGVACLLRAAASDRRALQRALWAARAPGGVRVVCAARPRRGMGSALLPPESLLSTSAAAAEAGELQDPDRFPQHMPPGAQQAAGATGAHAGNIAGGSVGWGGARHVKGAYAVTCHPARREVWVTGAARRGRASSAGGGDNERRVFRFDSVYQGVDTRRHVYGEIRPVVRAALDSTRHPRDERRAATSAGSSGTGGGGSGPTGGGEACIMAADAAVWEEALGEDAGTMVLRALWDDAAELCSGEADTAAGRGQRAMVRELIGRGSIPGETGVDSATAPGLAKATAGGAGSSGAGGGGGASTHSAAEATSAAVGGTAGILSVSIAMVEIHNDRVLDLLAPPIVDPRRRSSSSRRKNNNNKKAKAAGGGGGSGGGSGGVLAVDEATEDAAFRADLEARERQLPQTAAMPAAPSMVRGSNAAAAAAGGAAVAVGIPGLTFVAVESAEQGRVVLSMGRRLRLQAALHRRKSPLRHSEAHLERLTGGLDADAAKERRDLLRRSHAVAILRVTFADSAEAALVRQQQQQDRDEQGSRGSSRSGSSRGGGSSGTAAAPQPRRTVVLRLALLGLASRGEEGTGVVQRRDGLHAKGGSGSASSSSSSSSSAVEELGPGVLDDVGEWSARQTRAKAERATSIARLACLGNKEAKRDAANRVADELAVSDEPLHLTTSLRGLAQAAGNLRRMPLREGDLPAHLRAFAKSQERPPSSASSASPSRSSRRTAASGGDRLGLNLEHTALTHVLGPVLRAPATSLFVVVADGFLLGEVRAVRLFCLLLRQTTLVADPFVAVFFCVGVLPAFPRTIRELTKRPFLSPPPLLFLVLSHPNTLPTGIQSRGNAPRARRRVTSPAAHYLLGHQWPPAVRAVGHEPASGRGTTAGRSSDADSTAKVAALCIIAAVHHDHARHGLVASSRPTSSCCRRQWHAVFAIQVPWGAAC